MSPGPVSDRSKGPGNKTPLVPSWCEPLHDERDFIVAEVSKNWIDGHGLTDDQPIAALFEQVIERNRQRGYRLLTFQLHRLMVRPDQMNETIIAVFERAEPRP